VLIPVFSVFEPDLFNEILHKLTSDTITSAVLFKNYFPTIMLVAVRPDFSSGAKYNYLSKQGKQPIVSFEMSEELARAMDAVKYMECLPDRTRGEKGFEGAVWGSLHIFEAERRTKKDKEFLQKLLRW